MTCSGLTMPDATLQWSVAEAHLRAWLIAAPRFAEEVRQTVLTIVTVVLVGLTMLLPSGTPMEIILQADIVSCGYGGTSLAIQRVACIVPSQLLTTRLCVIIRQTNNRHYRSSIMSVERISSRSSRLRLLA
jgi:hypothetical protein